MFIYSLSVQKLLKKLKTNCEDFGGEALENFEINVWSTVAIFGKKLFASLRSTYALIFYSPVTILYICPDLIRAK